MNRVFLRVFCTVALVVAASGCATLFGGPSDAELVAALMAKWETAFEANELETILSCYSEDFTGTNSSSKERLRAFLSGMIDGGVLEGIQIDLEQAETTIEGETARVAPVALEVDYNYLSLDLELRKETDGVWRIVGSQHREG